MNIELGKEELEILQDLLRSDLLDLKEEIHHTDAHDLKVQLRSREKIIEGIVDKLTTSIKTTA